MEVGQIIKSVTGDKKGLVGEILQIDTEKERVQVKWPRGFMKTWVKQTSVI